MWFLRARALPDLDDRGNFSEFKHLLGIRNVIQHGGVIERPGEFG
jgi:hypothetical protein